MPAPFEFPFEQFADLVDVVPHPGEEPNDNQNEADGDHVEYSGNDRIILGEIL